MVTILLSTYNGEKYLEEQLDSLFSQTEDIQVFARDDGSCDNTINILQEYMRQSKLDFYADENIGVAKSFLTLLKKAPPSEFYAFCDQDDVWDRDKLEIAIKYLKQHDGSIPLLYCSATRPVDENLNLIKVKTKKKKYKLTFGESLVLSLASGCTFVFNYALKKLFDDKDINFISIHDWYIHKVAAACGKVIYDSVPHISYRQHNTNVIGYNKDTIFKKVKRFLFNTNKNNRYFDAISLRKNFFDNMSETDKKTVCLLTDYKKSFCDKRKLLRCKEIKTLSKKQNFKLYFTILFGRL